MLERRKFLLGAGGALAGLGLSAVSGGPRARAGDASLSERFDLALRSDPRLFGFKGLADRQLAAGPLPIEGRLPDGLRGTFYRNGPARHEIGDFRYHHWFDGDGMVHAFRIGDGEVHHRGRMVQTAKYVAEEAAGRPLVEAFGTVPPGAAPVRAGDDLNVANISVIEHADELLALWEGGSAYKLDPESLETLGPKVWSDDVAGLPFSAHPRRDRDGALWNFGTAPFLDAFLLYVISPDGTLREAKVFRGLSAPLVHDFILTERFAIVISPPFAYEQDRKGSFLDRHVWRPEESCRVFVFDKNTLELDKVLELPPHWVFHFSNAYEDGDVIDYDFPRYEDPSIITEAFRDVMAGDVRPLQRGAQLVRARLDLKSGAYTEEPLGEGLLRGEFPRVHPAAQGRRHREFLCLGATRTGSPAALLDTVAYIDRETGKTTSYTYETDETAEEHIIVAPKDGGGERDGWVLGTTLNHRTRRTSLNVFELKALGNGPLARVVLPYGLPFGLHGNFVAA